ncbi:HmuY protein [Alkalispirochaeta americana]|uniref:HmuY protein n=1 Tax=Alkalispirochaeta americana TaxID=159291 RepID=A0A1N6Q6P5_9SPIO|nr:HmuY family protein [Alkalispirochaeta americana]SIQ12268.1 HmuY protein [Alkalispirochaeta americana]
MKAVIRMREGVPSFGKGVLVGLLGVALTVLAGCDAFDSGSSSSSRRSQGTVALTVPDGGIRFVTLATGSVSASGDEDLAASDRWDLALDSGRFIYTNSGATADHYSSGGEGGVWYTGKTSLDEVHSVTGATFAGVYNTDALRWIDYPAMMGGSRPVRMNVMTYVGYDNEPHSDGTADGSESDPFSAIFLYNQEEYYYNAGGMPPDFRVRNRVYIVRHGDGSGYSAVQVSGLENGEDSSRIYELQYKALQ